MLPRTLLVAHAFLASRPTPSLAQPLLDALSEKTRESASLGQLLDDHAIVIARSTARRCSCVVRPPAAAIVTAAVPLFVGSAALRARIVAVAGLGTVAGAVYTPAVVIEPRPASSMLQVT